MRFNGRHSPWFRKSRGTVTGEPYNAGMKSLLYLALAALALLAAPASAQNDAPVELRILAINDFHGNLRPPPGGIRISDPSDKTKKILVPAGGAEYMATLVKQLREGHNNNDVRRGRRPDRREPFPVGDVP